MSGTLPLPMKKYIFFMYYYSTYRKKICIFFNLLSKTGQGIYTYLMEGIENKDGQLI